MRRARARLRYRIAQAADLIIARRSDASERLIISDSIRLLIEAGVISTSVRDTVLRYVKGFIFYSFVAEGFFVVCDIRKGNPPKSSRINVSMSKVLIWKNNRKVSEEGYPICICKVLRVAEEVSDGDFFGYFSHRRKYPNGFCNWTVLTDLLYYVETLRSIMKKIIAVSGSSNS